MDLDFLTKYAKKNNPLDLQNIKESIENKQFYLVATNLDNGKAIKANNIKMFFIVKYINYFLENYL